MLLLLNAHLKSKMRKKLLVLQQQADLNDSSLKSVRKTPTKKQLQPTNLKSKQQQKSDSVIDYLNKCDEAISAIIDDAALDADVEVPDACKLEIESQPHHQVVGHTPVKIQENMLDSLREEIFKEELLQQNKHHGTDSVPKEHHTHSGGHL